MGIGERCIEKGLEKYALEVVDVLDADRGEGTGGATFLNASVKVEKTGDSSERVCCLEPGDPVYLILDGAPDEAGCVKVVARSGIVLAPLEDIRVRQIALRLLMGAVYRGEIIDVVPRGSECEFSLQFRRCVCREHNEP